MSNPKWLEWVQKLQALAQNGLAYSTNPFDIERYQQIRLIAAEMIADKTHRDASEIESLLKDQAGYATPKVDARGVVICDGRILMVQELSDGGWTLPGGWVDVGESPAAAVEREVWEESGYRVKAVKLAALFDRNLHPHPPHLFHIYKLFFLCELTGGAPQDSIETAGASFFSQDEIPPLSAGRITTYQIQRMFEHFRIPDLPTDFD